MSLLQKIEYFPVKWKLAEIILKPCKPMNEIKSYSKHSRK